MYLVKRSPYPFIQVYPFIKDLRVTLFEVKINQNHTQLIVYARIYSQCLQYCDILHITLCSSRILTMKNSSNCCNKFES